MTVETIVMKAFVVCLISSLLFLKCLLKKFSTASGALNVQPVAFDYVQRFVYFDSPVDYIEQK